MIIGRRLRQCLIFCCIFLILLSVESRKKSLAAVKHLSADNPIIVWAQVQGNEYPILLSYLQTDEWSKSVKISNNDKLNLVPSVTADRDGDLWVVWASFNRGETDLYYARYQKETWSKEEKIETGLRSNIAPSIVLDKEGTLWLVWSGGDGQDDDIFYSRWNGAAFEPAERVTDNEIPDILPVLGMGVQGKPWVQWQHYSDTGYVTMKAEWTEDGWSEPSLVSEASQFALLFAKSDSKAAATNYLNIIIPEFVEKPESASLYISGQDVQSFPVRLIEKYHDK